MNINHLDEESLQQIKEEIEGQLYGYKKAKKEILTVLTMDYDQEWINDQELIKVLVLYQQIVQTYPKINALGELLDLVGFVKIKGWQDFEDRYLPILSSVTTDVIAECIFGSFMMDGKIDDKENQSISNFVEGLGAYYNDAILNDDFIAKLPIILGIRKIVDKLSSMPVSPHNKNLLKSLKEELTNLS